MESRASLPGHHSSGRARTPVAPSILAVVEELTVEVAAEAAAETAAEAVSSRSAVVMSQ